MKTAKGYVLKCLSGQYYIVPSGQRIADRGRCLKINETGSIIWKYLENDVSWEELLSYGESVFGAQGVSKEQLEQDLKCFLQNLKNYGMIEQQNSDETSSCTKDYEIAGFRIIYSGKEKWIHSYLNSFEEKQNKNLCEKETQHWHVRGLSEIENYEGKLILFGRQMDIYQCSDTYILRFHMNLHLVMCKISEDGKEAVFYYDGSDSVEGTDELFYGMRAAFLYFAALHKRYALHSSSICYSNKAWLFSAASGTGKSTHTELWQKLFKIQLINGDINLCGMENGQAYVYGIPWCGTSKVYDTLKYPLGGIILLKRADSDYVQELSKDEKQLLVSQRLISPSWDCKQLDNNLEFAAGLAAKTVICRLCCTPNDSAAVEMKKYIDKVIMKAGEYEQETAD